MNSNVIHPTDPSRFEGGDRLIDWGLRTIDSRETAPDFLDRINAAFHQTIVRHPSTVRMEHGQPSAGHFNVKTRRQSWTVILIAVVALATVGLMLFPTPKPQATGSPIVLTPNHNTHTPEQTPNTKQSVPNKPSTTAVAKTIQSRPVVGASTHCRPKFDSNFSVAAPPKKPVKWKGREVQIHREMGWESVSVGYTVSVPEFRLRIERYTVSGKLLGRVKPFTKMVPGRSRNVHRSVVRSMKLLDETGTEIDMNSKDGQLLVGKIEKRDAEYGKAYAKARELEKTRREQEYDNRTTFVKAVNSDTRSSFSLHVTGTQPDSLKHILHESYWPLLSRRDGTYSVHVEAMVNAFDYDYTSQSAANTQTLPNETHPLTIHPEVATCPWNPKHQLIRIGIDTLEPPKPSTSRPPINVVFVVDITKSSQKNTMWTPAAYVLHMANRLNEHDRISIVDASNGHILLPSTAGSQREDILNAINRMVTAWQQQEDSTPCLEVAYQIANENLIEDGRNLVVLCNNGPTIAKLTDQRKSIQQLITSNSVQNSIQLHTMHFNAGGQIIDDILTDFAKAGQGDFHDFVHSDQEAKRIAGHMLHGTPATVAADTKIQIEFNPQQVREHRLLGFQSQPLDDSHYDDASIGVDIGEGHSVTAIYEVVTRNAPNNLASTEHLCKIRLKYRRPNESKKRSFEVAVQPNSSRFENASTDFRFATAVAGFGMLLKKTNQMGTASFDSLHKIAAASIGDDPTGKRAELTELIKIAIDRSAAEAKE